MIKKYRKKPVVIEAIEFTGTVDNIGQLLDFVMSGFAYDPRFNTLTIPTLEGDHTANIGDYIIKGVNGEFYPCKPDIFKKTYEEVEG